MLPWLLWGRALRARPWRRPKPPSRSAFSGIQEICPGSYGNSKKTQGPGWTGCPFPSKPVFSLRPWGPLRNSRSWPVLASADRRDCPVRNSNRFCRSFRLSRNHRIASKIIARDPFCSDSYLRGIFHGIPRISKGRSPGSTKLSQDRTETRRKLKVARGQVARYEPGCAGLGRAGIGRAGEGAI